MTTRKQFQDALNGLVKDAEKAFPDQPDRVAQLKTHVATIGMVLDHLYDNDTTGGEEKSNG